MFKRVLVPLNLTESFDEVCSLIGFLQHFNTQTVRLVTVAGASRRAQRSAQKKLDAYRDGCENGTMSFETVSIAGSPIRGILKQSEEMDIIAFPWERKSILQHALLGSVTKDVVRLSQKPVFVYKQWFLRKDAELKTVLFPSDLHPVEEWVMPYLTYPGVSAERLVILHAGRRAPDPDAESQRRVMVDEKMDGIIKTCRSSFAEIEKVSVIGKPHTAIIRKAYRESADLVTISKNSRGTTRQKVLGSIAENIVHRARCSVLVIPGKEEAVKRS